MTCCMQYFWIYEIICKIFPFCQKKSFSSLFSTFIQNAKLVSKVVLLRFLLEDLRNPILLHVACHNLSQIDVTQTLRSFQGVINCLPIILNTYIEEISVFFIFVLIAGHRLEMFFFPNSTLVGLLNSTRDLCCRDIGGVLVYQGLSFKVFNLVCS